MTKATANDLRQMSRLGVDIEKGRKATINKHRRLIMAICAMEKCGKTTFGLSAPKPLLYLNFDRKIEQVVLDEMHITEEDIYIREVRVDGDAAQDQHKKQWEEVRELFRWGLEEAEGIRSIVVDTESEMWELIRMAYFGKLTQVMPYQYTEVNAVYKTLLDKADRCDKNLVLLRKMKKQYKNDKWNGRYEPAGFGKAKDIVQVNAEMYMMEGDEEGEEEFTFEILNNGLQASLNHMTFQGEMCNFPFVAAMLTNTTPDEWE